jgi:hypothetical protein
MALLSEVSRVIERRGGLLAVPPDAAIRGTASPHRVSKQGILTSSTIAETTRSAERQRHGRAVVISGDPDRMLGPAENSGKLDST